MGGFATPSRPGVLPPGYVDPRVRAFTRAILDPDLVAQFGEDAVRQAGISGLVPPPEDLDRVALFAPPPISGEWNVYDWLDTSGEGPLPDGSFREPTWQDVLRAGTAIGRPDLDGLAVRSCIAWWAQAYALGSLPQDEQFPDIEGSDTWNWPPSMFEQSGGPGEPQTVRKIYFWGFGKDGRLYQHMQLQKNDYFHNFHVWNKWGQALTFVRESEGKWIAGWDFGDWFTQNKIAIVNGLQLAVTAILMCIPFANAAVGAVAGMIFGVSQFGLSIGVSAAIGAAATAQQAFVAAMIAVAKGDIGEAFKYFSNMVDSLGGIPIAGDASAIPPELQAFVENPAVKGLASVIKEAGTGEISALVAKGAEMAKANLIAVGVSELFEARKLVPGELKPFFDQAVRDGANALAKRSEIPWYALGVFDFGTAMGTLADPSTAGIHVPRSIPAENADANFTLEELEAELAAALANYDRVAASQYGQTHPAFLAQYQKNIDELAARIEIKKHPYLAPQEGGGDAVTTFSAILGAKPSAPGPVDQAVLVVANRDLLAYLVTLKKRYGMP
jgi:hypothetical protein